MNLVMRKAVQAGISANVWLYRRTNGRVGGRGIGRLRLLLLTCPDVTAECRTPSRSPA